ncbi:MAG: hypothetical protein IJ849_10915 [Selenomonadaceae bacterium]|nr:hypothetical protein [Selenomonadaceae bacterium]
MTRNGQKGQGMVDYALIIAFVVAIGLAISGSGLGDAIKNVLADTGVAIAGKDNYADALNKYGSISTAELKQVSNAERIAIDKAALSNLGKIFLGKTEAEVKALLGVNNITGGNNPYGAILFDYEVASSDDGAPVTKLRYNGGSFNSLDAVEWMKGNYTRNTANDYTASKTINDARYLFSDDAISKTPQGISVGNYSATIRGQFEFTDGKVSAVTINTTRSIQKSGGYERHECEGLTGIRVTE